MQTRRNKFAKYLNTLTLGLFFGTLLGFGLLFFLDILFATLSFTSPLAQGIKSLFFLLAALSAIIATFQSSGKIALCLPFIRLNSTEMKSRELLLDLPALSDERVVDLGYSGLLDQRLLVPRFLLRELTQLEESLEEGAKTKAKQALEILHKLESHPSLQLRYTETDFAEIKDPSQKILKVAKFLDADLLTADPKYLQNNLLENVRLIHLHKIAYFMKPSMNKGESLKIKIQRVGKEEGQGVGYLEDGTMVVVNGGGPFLGDIIATQVVSVKQTVAGRMIFCNVLEEIPC